MVLGFVGVVLGLYGTKKIIDGATYDLRSANMTYNQYLDPEQLCKHLGYKKHKNKYPMQALNGCLDYLNQHNLLTDDNKIIFTERFNEMLNKQQQEYKQACTSEYEYMCKKWEEANNKGLSLDTSEITIHHWVAIGKEEHEKRIDKIWNETIWSEIAVSKPFLVKSKKAKDTYIEKWQVKYPMFHKHIIKNIYNACCKQVGYNDY